MAVTIGKSPAGPIGGYGGVRTDYGYTSPLASKNTTLKNITSSLKPKTDPNPISTGSGGGGDWASGLIDLLIEQYRAEEKARKERLEQLQKTNDENASRDIGLINNNYNKTSNMLEKMSANGTNGALLSNRVNNALWKGNNTHDIINNRDNANANATAYSWDQKANNISTLTSGLTNLFANSYGLGDDAMNSFRKRLGEIYGNL